MNTLRFLGPPEKAKYFRFFIVGLGEVGIKTNGLFKGHKSLAIPFQAAERNSFPKVVISIGWINVCGLFKYG